MFLVKNSFKMRSIHLFKDTLWLFIYPMKKYATKTRKKDGEKKNYKTLINSCKEIRLLLTGWFDVEKLSKEILFTFSFNTLTFYYHK